MKNNLNLQEWKNNGTEWVYIGQWSELNEDQIDPLVKRWMTPTTKFVLTDKDDEFVREYI